MDNPNRRIPGPAHAVMRALKRKEMGKDVVVDGEDPLSTQEIVQQELLNDSVGDDQSAFESYQWQLAIRFSKSRELMMKTGLLHNVQNRTLATIGPMKKSYKVDKIVAMLDECTPNGFGDFMVMLKDPTGKLRGSIHRSAVEAHGGPQVFKVGVAMVIVKATVFMLPGVCCLNICDKNLLKVFTGDVMEGPVVNLAEDDTTFPVDSDSDSLHIDEADFNM